MQWLIILALLANLYVWQSPMGCYTYITHLGSWYVAVSNADHGGDACTNWEVQVFDSSKYQG